MKTIRVSAVSYANTVPFVYGIENSNVYKDIELSFDVPSICAEKLITDKADIGLVPVGIIPGLKEHYIISEYCIGAKGKVKTVLLASDVPLEQIQQVHLDSHSRTSNILVRVLAADYWKIKPVWLDPDGPFTPSKIRDNSAALIIGDKTFHEAPRHRFVYDLSEEWFNFTKLPFVFACWVANKSLPDDFIARFDEALKFGLSHIEEAARLAMNSQTRDVDIVDYLTHNINYDFDAEKQNALMLFFDFAAGQNLI